MAIKKFHLVVAIVGITAAAGWGWWYQKGDKPIEGLALAQAPGGASAPRGGPGGPGGSGGPGAGRGPGGPAAVEVGKVELMKLEDDAQAVGSIRARQGVILRPEVSGRVQSIGFSDGQRVKRGQLMVQLDDTLQQAQLKQAEASASIARTNLQRSRELAAQNFVSQSAVDQNAAALEVAQAQVALAQAQLARMKVYAPFDGITGIRSVNLGDYVKDGADLVTVEDISAVSVDFRLAERYLSRLKPGQAVELLLDSMPGKTYSAKVEALDSQLDVNGRAVLVRARLANPNGALRGGMFARARIVFAVRDNALVVPEEALVPQGNKQFLFKVLEGEGGAKVAQRVEVRVGVRVPGKAEILDGVQAGEVIVLTGHSRLLRGDKLPVRIVDMSRPQGARGPAGAGSPPLAAASGARPASAP